MVYALLKIIGFISAYLSAGDDYNWITHIAAPLIASGYAGYFYLKSGVYVAPKYKKTTAIILLVIMVSFLLFSTYLAISLRHWKTIVEVAGNVIGMTISFNRLKEDDFKTTSLI